MFTFTLFFFFVSSRDGDDAEDDDDGDKAGQGLSTKVGFTKVGTKATELEQEETKSPRCPSCRISSSDEGW